MQQLQQQDTTVFGPYVGSDATLRFTKIPVYGNPAPAKNGNITLIDDAEDFANEVEKSAAAALGVAVPVTAVQLTVGRYQEARVVVAPQHADAFANLTGLRLRGWMSTVERINSGASFSSSTNNKNANASWQPAPSANTVPPAPAAAADDDDDSDDDADDGAARAAGPPPARHHQQHQQQQPPHQHQSQQHQQHRHESRSPTEPAAAAPSYARGDDMRTRVESARRAASSAGSGGTPAASPLLDQALLVGAAADDNASAIRVCALVDDEEHDSMALGHQVLGKRGCEVAVVFNAGSRVDEQPDATKARAPDGYAIAAVPSALGAKAPHKVRSVLLRTGVFAGCSVGDAKKEDPAAFAAHPFTCFKLTLKTDDDGNGTENAKFWLVIVTAPTAEHAAARRSLPAFVTKGKLPVIVVGLVCNERAVHRLCGGDDDEDGDELTVAHTTLVAGAPDLCTVIATRGRRYGSPLFPPNDVPNFGGPVTYPLLTHIAAQPPDPLEDAVYAACLLYRQSTKDGQLQVIAAKDADGRYDLMRGRVATSVSAAATTATERVIDAALAGTEQVLGASTLTTTARGVLCRAMQDARMVLLGNATAVILVDTQCADTSMLQTLPSRFGGGNTSARRRIAWCRCPELRVVAEDRVQRDRRMGDTLLRAAFHSDLSELFDASLRSGDDEIEAASTTSEPFDRDGKPWRRTAAAGQSADERIAAEVRQAMDELEKAEEAIAEMGLVPDTPDPALVVVPKGSAEASNLHKELAAAGAEPHAILRVCKSFQTADVIDKLRQGVRNMVRVYHTTKSETAAVAIATNGPDFTLANPGGNSGAGFYTSPDLMVSKGYGNSTLIVRLLQGKSFANIGVGSQQAQQQKLQQAQANSAAAAHCNEIVVYDADQLKFDYVVFWNETPEVAGIVEENRRLAEEAAAARQQFVQRQEDLTEKRDRLNAYVNMLHMIATDDTTSDDDKAELLEAEIAERKSAPGIYRLKPDILRDARGHMALVAGGRPPPATGLPLFELQCATGSGKSLYVPQYLAFNVLPRRRLPSDPPSRVLVLVPTRMIAEQVSEKAAEMRGTRLGTEVGYSIGGKRCFDRNGAGSTRIVYMTYMLFLKGELQSNPELHGVDAIVFDEAHKSQADVNVAVGLIPIVRRRCPRAMIFVSSATLPDGLVASLGSPHTRRFVLGQRGFPVSDVSRPPKDDQEEQDVVGHMLSAVSDVMQQGPKGNLLCFLPNKRTVEDAAQRARAMANGNAAVEVLAINAHSPPGDRKRVGEPTQRGGCRIIFATSYLDEGITAHNVAHVLDCGRTQTERPSTSTPGKYEVHVQYVSQHTAIQRRGRTGRTCSGEYTKLYDDKRLRRGLSQGGAADDDSFEADGDGAGGLVMEWVDWLPTLLALGVRNPATLRFPHPPSHRDLGVAVVRLHALGVLDAAAASARLTERGEIVASMPFPTAHSCLVLESAAYTIQDEDSHSSNSTAWSHAAAVAAAFKVERLTGRRLFAAAEDAFAARRKRQPPFQSDFAAIADVFHPVIAAANAGHQQLPFKLDGPLVRDMRLDWDHARIALHYGSPERQQRLLKDLLQRHCRVARGRDEITPLGRYAASACSSPVDLRVLLESADVWFESVQEYYDFTLADIEALLSVLPDSDGQQLVPINVKAGALTPEAALTRAAATVFAQNVAIPNDPTTLNVPCVVTNEAMDSGLVDNKCFVQRTNLPPGKVVLFGRFEHVSDEKGKVMTFLKHVTIADDDGSTSLMQVADQLLGVFKGDENGFGNQPNAPNLSKFSRRIVLPLPQCQALAPTGPHQSKPLQDQLTKKPTAVVVFPHANANRGGGTPALIAGFSGANLGAEAVLAGALALGCGLFPNLHAALVNPPAPAAAAASKHALWQYVIHVLVHAMGLTVYGGAVRDFLLRGEDLTDIDVSASSAIARMSPQGIVQQLQQALAGLNGVRVQLAPRQKQPTVAAVIDVVVGQHRAQLEFVDPAIVPNAVDMSCNNVQVCNQGLRLKRNVAGASLSLIIWQIRNKKGTILDASETPYQHGRRAKMVVRGWSLWNLGPNNTVNGKAAQPPELATKQLDWSMKA